MDVNDRAKECVRAIQAMAIQSSQMFMNEPVLTDWFKNILKHETQAIVELLEGMKGKCDVANRDYNQALDDAIQAIKDMK